MKYTTGLAVHRDVKPFAVVGVLSVMLKTASRGRAGRVSLHAGDIVSFAMSRKNRSIGQHR